MPYIRPERRKHFVTLLKEFRRLTAGPITPGDLNYIISRFSQMFIESRELNYKVINALIGVLECCKLELYRRVAVPYEDKKAEENGDVF